MCQPAGAIAVAAGATVASARVVTAFAGAVAASAGYGVGIFWLSFLFWKIICLVQI